MADWLLPDWPAPPHIGAAVTTRTGGCSTAPFASWNLGGHVGDEPDRVARNRALLRQRLGLATEPLWLEQVHGCDLLECDAPPLSPPRADAAMSRQPGQVCAVLTADCLPLLICDRAGSRVAAVHAGWRGLAAGIIEKTLARFDCPGSELLVWLGPAIGPDAFEVGKEVRSLFTGLDPAAAKAFRPSPSGRWLADLYALARIRLAPWRPAFVGGGDCCTYTDSRRFFSYRRDGRTGRMASLIWIRS